MESACRMAERSREQERGVGGMHGRQFFREGLPEVRPFRGGLQPGEEQERGVLPERFRLETDAEHLGDADRAGRSQGGQAFGLRFEHGQQGRGIGLREQLGPV